MGAGGISIGSLLIILAIVIFVFGTKRLRNLGGDLGGAIKGFRKAMNDDANASEQKKIEEDSEKPGNVYDAKPTDKQDAP